MKTHFQPVKIIFNGFLNQKVDFLTTDKTFVQDNFDFVLDKVVWTKVLPGQKDEAWDKIDFVWDKKYFVRAEGTGKSVKRGGHLLFITKNGGPIAFWNEGQFAFKVWKPGAICFL